MKKPSTKAIKEFKEWLEGEIAKLSHFKENSPEGITRTAYQRAWNRLWNAENK